MTLDKSKTLTASVRLLNEKLHFEGNADNNEPVSIDYTPPLGDGLGYTSLELFLLSLSSCAGSAILFLSRKMNKHIAAFEMTATGIRKEDHPTGFSEITMDVNIRSNDLNAVDMEKILNRIETICPVLSMLDKSVRILFKSGING